MANEMKAINIRVSEETKEKIFKLRTDTLRSDTAVMIDLVDAEFTRRGLKLSKGKGKKDKP